MVHNDEQNKHRSRLSIAVVALVFCSVWALIGEADIRIAAVTIAFMSVLKAGIDKEMSEINVSGH